MTEHELSERIARLEERMQTNQAEYKTDIARLAEDMAKRDVEAAKRETRLLLAIGAMLAVGFTALGFLFSQK